MGTTGGIYWTFFFTVKLVDLLGCSATPPIGTHLLCNNLQTMGGFQEGSTHLRLETFTGGVIQISFTRWIHHLPELKYILASKLVVNSSKIMFLYIKKKSQCLGFHLLDCARLNTQSVRFRAEQCKGHFRLRSVKHWPIVGSNYWMILSSAIS